MSVTKRISSGNYNLTTSTSSNVVVTTGTFQIFGNLYVQGNSTVVNVANISTADPTLTLNSNVSTPFAGNSGLEVYRGPTNYTPALYWNEVTKSWQITSNIANAASFSNIATTSGASGVVASGTATHFPFYANTGAAVEDAGSSITWDRTNSILNVTGNVTTTNLTVNGNYITASTPNSGGTGLYFSNSTAGELVSNTRALALSIIFG